MMSTHGIISLVVRISTKFNTQSIIREFSRCLMLKKIHLFIPNIGDEKDPSTRLQSPLVQTSSKLQNKWHAQKYTTQHVRKRLLPVNDRPRAQPIRKVIMVMDNLAEISPSLLIPVFKRIL
jgi:hypothetical protein